MRNLNSLGKMIRSMDPDKIKLDGNVKKILAYKPLLARIFKEVVAECRNLTYEEIEKYIEGEVMIDGVFMEGGLSNAGELIRGQANEDYQNEEGLIRYDIRTSLSLPQINVRSVVKILLDVESQNEEKPGYDIPLRALFYCCRMISSQLGVEFTVNSDDPVKYGNLKKVYSIFICTETAQKRANSIEQYEIARKFLYGKNKDAPRYDILNATIINISGKHDLEGTDHNLIKLLTALFNETISANEKIGKIEMECGLPLTREIKEEVASMCTYSDSIETRGIQKGISQGINQGISQGIKQGISQGIIQGLDKGLKAMVTSLKVYIKDFDSLYEAVKKNDEYADVTKEQVRRYF